VQELEEPPRPNRHVPGTVIFVGHARLPQSLGLIDSSSVVCIEIEVDPSTGRVTRVGASGVLPCAAALLGELLEGSDFDSRIDAVLEELQRRYVSPCQRAICSALASCHEAYLRYCRQEAHVSASALD